MSIRWALCCSVGLLAACEGSDDMAELANPGNSLVYASRESRQCEADGITAAESAQRLIDGGIDVIDSTCGVITGVAYPAVCGGPTGDILIHEIRTVNVPDAEPLGYSEVGTLVDVATGTGYMIVDCDEREPVPTP